jgi:hypothetical protein
VRGVSPTLLALALAAPAATGAPPKAGPVPAPRVPKAEDAPVGSLSPPGQVRAAAQDMATRVGPDDKPYALWVSLYGAEPARVPELSVLLVVLLNTASQGPDVSRPYPVPGTGLCLWRVDLRAYRWNRAAVSAVARRDPFFREPLCPHRESEYLRREIGVHQDDQTFAVEAVVSATYLLRDLLQPDQRSDTYYDLLYAAQRFDPTFKGDVRAGAGAAPDPGPEPARPEARVSDRPVRDDRGNWHPAGTPFIDGAVWAKYLADLDGWKAARAAPEGSRGGPAPRVPPGLRKDFPATRDEFEEFWGAKVADKFAKDRGFFVRNGEVVAGAHNDPRRGSYVAYNDRLIAATPVPTGVYLETYDALATAKDRDYLEDPIGSADGKVGFDAGELLVNVPNGFQAALLVNGQGKRVEKADSGIARNTLDLHYDVTVRTQIGCVQCHAQEYGFINPSNRLFREAVEGGVALKVKDKGDEEKVRAFFLGWEEKAEAWRAPYKVALRKATCLNPADPADRGWTPAQLARVMIGFRDWYDAPVTLDRAAAELGLSRAQAFYVFGKSPSARLNQLATGQAVPRQAWDQRLAAEAALLVDASREEWDKLAVLFGWTYVEQAAKGVKK